VTVTPTAKLRDLAGLHGISCSYRGWDGLEHDVSDDTLQRILDALDVAARTPEDVEASLADVADRPWRRMLPPSLVVVEGENVTFPVHVPHGDPVSVWVVTEDGREVEVEQLDVWVDPRSVDGRLVGRATFAVPRLSLGWHTLHARSNDVEVAAGLVVTPRRLATADRLLETQRWGLAVQLYSVRSRRSWGVGDFADLADLAAVTAGHGGDFVLINPVHAAEPVPPHEPSPYLPSSRRFVDPLYLRVEDIPEVAYLPEKHRKLLVEHAARFSKANKKAGRIDRDTSFRAKLDVLERVYKVTLGPARRARFEAFCAEGGRALDDFALWCAVFEKFGDRRERWESRAPSPDDPTTERLRTRLAARIDFYRWLQWLCDEQLTAAQDAAHAAGLEIGILHDLAVGVRPHGADAWTLGDALASGVTVGAPPDDFNHSGQNWNQPPWRPDRLAAAAYAPFREMVSTILRHAGGLRVDHVIGLFRLWWVPRGAHPTQGTYVRYDHEAMIGILALEAHRAGAVVVGEDLGTVQPWVRDYLRERGILGTSILWFEFDWDGDGAPLPPEKWREYCLASVTTHDLPPTAGFLTGDHVRLRDQLGVLTRSLDEELQADQADRQAWLDNLRNRGALQPDAGVEEMVEALHRYLTWTPSRLLNLSLADAVGERQLQNQPGTIDEYPNWRVPLTGPDDVLVMLEDIFTNQRTADLAEIMSSGH
jgi:4-alpha-glucanotransferase